MIDGENLRQGAEGNQILFDDLDNSKLLLSHIEQEIGCKLTSKMMVSTKKEADQQFIKNFEKCGVKFLEKNFKKKSLTCCNNECNTENEYKVQAEVDIAIVVEIFRRYVDGLATNNQLKTVVLITGDVDFTPLVEFFKERLRVNIYIVSFKQNLSEKLLRSVGGDENYIELNQVHFKKDAKLVEESKTKIIKQAQPLTRKMMGVSLTREPVHKLNTLHNSELKINDLRVGRFNPILEENSPKFRRNRSVRQATVKTDEKNDSPVKKLNLPVRSIFALESKTSQKHEVSTEDQSIKEEKKQNNKLEVEILVKQPIYSKPQEWSKPKTKNFIKDTEDKPIKKKTKETVDFSILISE